MSAIRVPTQYPDTGAVYGGCKVCGQPWLVGQTMVATTRGAVHIECARPVTDTTTAEQRRERGE